VGRVPPELDYCVARNEAPPCPGAQLRRTQAAAIGGGIPAGSLLRWVCVVCARICFKPFICACTTTHDISNGALKQNVTINASFIPSFSNTFCVVCTLPLLFSQCFSQVVFGQCGGCVGSRHSLLALRVALVWCREIRGRGIVPVYIYWERQKHTVSTLSQNDKRCLRAG
jgi:hypothetical protein